MSRFVSVQWYSKYSKSFGGKFILLCFLHQEDTGEISKFYKRCRGWGTMGTFMRWIWAYSGVGSVLTKSFGQHSYFRHLLLSNGGGKLGMRMVSGSGIGKTEHMFCCVHVCLCACMHTQYQLHVIMPAGYGACHQRFGQRHLQRRHVLILGWYTKHHYDIVSDYCQLFCDTDARYDHKTRTSPFRAVVVVICVHKFRLGMALMIATMLWSWTGASLLSSSTAAIMCCHNFTMLVASADVLKRDNNIVYLFIVDTSP